MRLFFIVLTAFSFFAAPGLSAAETRDKALIADLDALFADAQLDINTPGLVYGVVADGKLVHVKGYGVRNVETGAPVTAKTRFRIASMTKMMTALIVLDLVEEGKISLDAPAETYVPALTKIEYPTTDSRKITVRDLLSHTAGFVTDNPWADRQLARTPQEFDAFLANAAPLSHAPGEKYDYSNLGFAIVGRIIENVSGESYAGILRERLLAPLGMNDTTLDMNAIPAGERAGAYHWLNNEFVDEPVLGSGTFDAIGGLWTTAEDYGKFVAWFLSAWPARDGADNGPIPRAVVRSVADAAHLRGASRRGGLGGSDDCVMSSAYGMGLGISRHCDAGLVLGHSGGLPGFGSYVMMMPERGLGLFVFANRTYAPTSGPAWDAGVKLAKSGLAKVPAAGKADTRLLAAYQGVARAYAAGDIEEAGLKFADNFFPDRSVARWNAQLADMKAAACSCKSDAPLNPDGRLAGDFEWTCEDARIIGSMTMEPVDADEIAELRLRVFQRGAGGRELITDLDFH